ncbi:MAG: transglycosylase SLT domain-containing protein [Polyangiales bacterium]
MVRKLVPCLFVVCTLQACTRPLIRNPSQVVVAVPTVSNPQTPSAPKPPTHSEPQEAVISETLPPVSHPPEKNERTLAANVAVLPPDSPSMKMREALHNDDPAAALAIANASPKSDMRVHWLASIAAQKLEMPLATLEHLQTLASSAHPLAKPAALQLAEFCWRTEPQRVVDLTGGLTNGWSGAERMAVLRARALELVERRADAIAMLRPMATNEKGRLLSSDLAVELASQLAKSESIDDRKEALSLYRAVISNRPNSVIAESAAKSAVVILDGLPDEMRTSLASPKTLDEYGAAQAYYDSSNNKRAAKAFSNLAKKLQEHSALWCKAKMMEGRALLRMRERDEGSTILLNVADHCDDVDVIAWSRYLGGRALGRLGKWDEAIQQYDRLIEQFPKHRLSDDAAYRAALAELENQDEAAYEARIREVPIKFSDGDMWPDALFELAWHQKRQGNYAGAIETLKQIDARGEPRDDEARVGQAGYWQGRLHQLLGENGAAANDFAVVAEKWPLRYYGYLSIKRLDSIDAARAEALRTRMTSKGDEKTLAFEWHEAFETESFNRALELLRVGEIGSAKREFGFANNDHNDANIQLVSMILIQNVDDEQPLPSSFRTKFKSFSSLMPTDDGRIFWELAYPQSFKPLVEKVARSESIPPSLVRSVAREESSFTPTAVSPAGAYGLVQLMLDTAKRFASDLKIRVTPATLKKPKTNLKIGARYLAWLFNRQPHPGLVVPSYNAGENAVRRWLENTTTDELDEFVEAIPYDETKRYTRRVLQSYCIYSWLYEKKLPEISLLIRQKPESD